MLNFDKVEMNHGHMLRTRLTTSSPSGDLEHVFNVQVKGVTHHSCKVVLCTTLAPKPTLLIPAAMSLKLTFNTDYNNAVT